jgi:hypothetical protein
VAYGEMFVDLERRLFLGRGLTTAFELEQRQDWVGVALDDSVNLAFPTIFSTGNHAPILEALFPRYEVPFKFGPVSALRTVNWRWNLVVKRGTRSLFQTGSDWSERGRWRTLWRMQVSCEPQDLRTRVIRKKRRSKFKPFLLATVYRRLNSSTETNFDDAGRTGPPSLRRVQKLGGRHRLKTARVRLAVGQNWHLPSFE